MNIQAYLKKEGLTQAEFAGRIGVSSAAVSQWLNKARNISARKAKHIQEVTGGAIRLRDLLPDLFG